MKRKPCIICGARVRNQNPKTNTCDPVCTRAKHEGRKSRAAQLKHEMQHPDKYALAEMMHNDTLNSFQDNEIEY